MINELKDIKQKIKKSLQSKYQKVVIKQKVKYKPKQINEQYFKKITQMQFHQKYQLLQSIATSSNNDMYRAKRKSDSKIFMVKKVHYSRMQQKQKHQVVQQVNILTEINSISIVKYYQHFVQKVENTLYVVMQYQPLDLLRMMKKYQSQGKHFSQDKIWRLLKQIVLALKDIHRNKKGTILHRNIQPKSIFINNTSIKLGNFKFVKKLDSQEQFATTVINNTYYLSPQQLQSNVFTAKTDIWALGCLLYEICTFANPFEGSGLFEIGNKVREGKVKVLPPMYKKQLNRVIKWCLAKDPKDRPSVQDLLGVPMINLLIRQNRMSQVSKKINDKQKKNCLLQEQISRLEQIIQNAKKQQLRRSLNVDPMPRTSQNYSTQNKQNINESNLKRFDQIGLKRGMSEKLNDKTNYFRNTSSSISQLSNFTAICEQRYSSKLVELPRLDQNTYQPLNF